ncbi:hypothetical protein OBBRIDRAFT_811427 [Obba rivulosa]|uniref:Uncharacterized protein n=1 Tax=Obba rivulosa TaxID=1052685 RepID=A0A8E2AZ01_9APHY|nr:hypothetical protein OBBRIDRAFT_811427 [Obba rivulosa]
MRFSVRNAYYLRIAPDVVLPLYLYLDERHVEWMSERVLQHVLADLRPLIPVKLRKEADAHLGPGGSANAKRGELDVHRGDTYQFGYFLRKGEPHAVVMKVCSHVYASQYYYTSASQTRHFVPAPNPPSRQPTAPSPTDVESAPSRSKKRPPKKATAAQTRRKKRKTKGKERAIDLDEDEPIAISSDGDSDTNATAVSLPAAQPRRSTRTRKVVIRGYTEEDDDLMDASLAISNEANAETSDLPETVADSELPSIEPLAPSLDDPGLLRLDSEAPSSIAVKEEAAEPEFTAGLIADEVVDVEMDITAPPVLDTPHLPVEEDEDDNKGKLQLQLKYQGLIVYERCLCVIVEPYPPIRSATRARSLAPQGIIAPRAPSIAPADFVTSAERQRAKTPLFLPDDDRERSVTPAPFVPRRSIPPVPLFHEEPPDDESDGEDGGMMQFSQILRSVGEHQEGTVEDDDEIDGAVFFGDADEMREL